MEFVKTWHKNAQDLTDVYIPGYQCPPTRDEWTYLRAEYTYRSCAPISKLEILNEWIETKSPPRIVGNFFIRDGTGEKAGQFEVIPANLLVAPILVERYIHRIYYKIGADIDPCYDPNNEYPYHIKFGEMEGELDTTFTWKAEE